MNLGSNFSFYLVSSLKLSRNLRSGFNLNLILDLVLSLDFSSSSNSCFKK